MEILLSLQKFARQMRPLNLPWQCSINHRVNLFIEMYVFLHWLIMCMCVNVKCVYLLFVLYII